MVKKKNESHLFFLLLANIITDQKKNLHEKNHHSTESCRFCYRNN
jgi:hypothetical protein